MSTVGLFGLGTALPEQHIDNAHFEARLDTTSDWIVRRTGIRGRHWLNGHDTLTDLATEACAAALADAGRDGEEVDHVIVSTVTADCFTPGMAPEVAARIGAERAGAVDFSAACAGFLYGLDHAASLIESGRARVVVVCGAEALSRILDKGDRSTAVLFGDGAGAVVLARGDLDLGVTPFVLRADGRHRASLYATREEQLIRMEGQDVYRHAVERMTEAFTLALARAHMTVRDLDLFFAHQANIRIIMAVAERLGLDEDQIVVDVDRVANTSSASIPLALARAEADGRLKPGARVGLAAFGAGFVWGAGIVSWKERVHVCA